MYAHPSNNDSVNDSEDDDIDFGNKDDDVNDDAVHYDDNDGGDNNGDYKYEILLQVFPDYWSDEP